MTRFSKSWTDGKRVTPETALKKQIRQYLALKGWYVFPILQGMCAYKGIADLIAMKDGICYFLEAKSPRGKQSDHQVRFQQRVEDAGGRYRVIRSLDDLIVEGF